MKRQLQRLALAATILTSTYPLHGNGVLRDGYGTQSMAMGGTGVAHSEDPLTSMAMNPATLTMLDQPTLSLNLTGIHGLGDFDNAFNSHTGLGKDTGVFPEWALSSPIAESPFTLGLAFKVDAARLADWDFIDAPGGVDGATSYGHQPHQSEFLAMSATIGVGMELTDRLAIGVSAGLIYHRVGLDLPFIFQSEPTLAGYKTLLDLETHGFGWNASFGLLYHATDTLTIGLNYQTQASLHGHGKARGDVSAQLNSLGLADVESRFRYDAEVETALPQILSGGLSWQIDDRWRMALQVDWVQWSAAFDDLRVTLSDGSNAAINGLAGSDTLHDTVPVRWQDRLVYSAGAEYRATEDLRLQLGYRYGKSPIPSQFVTALNGSIFEHTLSAGLSMDHGPWKLGLSYQYYIPNAEGVNVSGYRSREYSNSDLKDLCPCAQPQRNPIILIFQRSQVGDQVDQFILAQGRSEARWHHRHRTRFRES